MLKYLSTTGESKPVSFDQAILQGFAEDGGLFVPERIPAVSAAQLQRWQSLSYVELAAEVLGCYIDPTVVPKRDLETLLEESFSSFTRKNPPLVSPRNDQNHWIMELFHGPTLSFKDVAMGFLIKLMDYFLDRNDERISLILATTGDTGPAAAYASAGKRRINCWPLYPASMISNEQEVQMTSIGAANINPVAVSGCTNGGDDLDVVVARLFGNEQLKRRLCLSSVNSINIGRVLMQTVHYFYGYLQVAQTPGDTVVFSVPAGAFGNLCAGALARAMGLPISFICATNKNKTLHRIFSEGVLKKAELQTSLSSAIDIVVPYNFWRFLYLRSGGDTALVRAVMREFEESAAVSFPVELQTLIREGFNSISVSDQDTLAMIAELYEKHHYLIDPHGSVALAGVEKFRHRYADHCRFVTLATAHPAKFPEVIRTALGPSEMLPAGARHESLEQAIGKPAKKLSCSLDELEALLIAEIEQSLADDQ